VPVPCNRIVTGLHKLPATTADRLPSIEDLPDVQYLQNKSVSKTSDPSRHGTSKQQKNEDHESSDEDHEEYRPVPDAEPGLETGDPQPQDQQRLPSAHSSDYFEEDAPEEIEQAPAI
jgi:hypothetical protein